MALPRIPAFKYTDAKPPAKYRCQSCALHGYRLFRELNTSASGSELLCAVCVVMKHDVSWDVDDRVIGPKDHREPPRVAAQWICAIPDTDGDSWWNASGAPFEGLIWWLLMPERVDKPHDKASVIRAGADADYVIKHYKDREERIDHG